jgi:hypothetical protein
MTSGFIDFLLQYIRFLHLPLLSRKAQWLERPDVQLLTAGG